ncbi:unnamed protein product [marine sediment metagenome]|uniref:FRG domain-containing protein n=1 Tax=marine sediment metagenome TaxID=412755 RepID=X1GKB9_9ZZZZ
MISTAVGFITRIRQVYQSWGEPHYIWFRGEPSCDTPLLPSVYRPKPDGSFHNENALLQMFRMRAPSYYGELIPNRGDTDQWLFLAQHVGLPTRLLDWTENALLALYFALKEKLPIVWMIAPIRLNDLSVSEKGLDYVTEIEEFPLTWFRPESRINIGHENIRGAWEQDTKGVNRPVAVHPTHFHPRMSAQRSVFTVHGLLKKSLPDLVPHGIISRFEIQPSARDRLSEDLRMLGIEEATAFPDLDGLAKELKDRY